MEGRERKKHVGNKQETEGKAGYGIMERGRRMKKITIEGGLQGER